MKLIRRNIRRRNHPSEDVVKEFEKAILTDESVTVASLLSECLFLPIIYLDKLSKKLKFSIIKVARRIFVLEATPQSENNFTVLMGDDFEKYYPYAFLNKKRKNIYLFDAWPEDQERILDFIKGNKIDRVFVSSSQACDDLNRKLGSKRVYWVSEGVDVTKYKRIPYEEKKIDVLQLGRKYDEYHQLILPYFQTGEHTYVYEKKKGQITFKDTEDFIDGLSNAKISVCVPSSITHPERSGNMQTMTNRYLQSIASKCLIVGFAPQEMIGLFGYNPVVEIDMSNPIGQIDNILKNYSDYIPLIERNFDTVSRFHTWKDKWNQIKTILNN